MSLLCDLIRERERKKEKGGGTRDGRKKTVLESIY